MDEISLFRELGMCEAENDPKDIEILRLRCKLSRASIAFEGLTRLLRFYYKEMFGADDFDSGTQFFIDKVQASLDLDEDGF